jgi:cytochrome c oxidase assembly protein subunit 15
VAAPIGSKINRLQQLSTLIVLTTLLQLAVAAVMRHHGAGLAIQSFPLSTASGLWLPESWPFAISIHFTHRVLALLLTVLVGLYCWRLWRLSQQAKQALWRRFAYLLGSLITVQILLGASVIWTLKRFPLVTTLHVIVGALFLTCLWLSLVLLRKAHPSNSVHT